MVEKDKKKLTLDRSVTYQIKVLGGFDKKWLIGMRHNGHDRK